MKQRPNGHNPSQAAEVELMNAEMRKRGGSGRHCATAFCLTLLLAFGALLTCAGGCVRPSENKGPRTSGQSWEGRATTSRSPAPRTLAPRAAAPAGLTARISVEPVITLAPERGADGAQYVAGRRVNLEDYVAGVVAGEMEPGWPLETYRAQAVLARTFSLDTLTQHNARPVSTGVISTSFVRSQEYKPSAITRTIRRAVRSTRGQVLVYGDNYARAFFHAAAGGLTARPSEVGLVPPAESLSYLRPVWVPEDAAPEEFRRWRVEIKPAKVSRALGALGKPLSHVRRAAVGRRDAAGRALTFVFADEKGKVEVNANSFRVALGPTRLRSTMVDAFKVQGGRLVASGRGFGHGVGMAQWGALTLARKGMRAEEILGRYYPGARLARLYQ